MKKPVNTRLPGSSTQDAAGHPTYIVLDTLDVSTAVNVGQIRTPEELYAVKDNPSGSYVVVADLDLTQEGDLGNITTTFKGTIDFQGHTVKFRASNDRKYLFADNQGTLKNIVLNTGFRDDDDLEEASGFVLNNNGVIENILVRFAECSNSGRYGHESVAGIIHTNGTKGELRNFAIDAEASLAAQRLASYGVAVNNGKIYNGYVYGESIDASKANQTEIEYQAYITGSGSSVTNAMESFKLVGGIAGANRSSGTIQEVYSVINVKRAPLSPKTVEIDGGWYARYDETSVGNTVGMNSGTISGAYGYVTLDPEEEEAYNYGPVVGRNDPATKVNNNTYYVADSNYTDNRLNRRVTKLMLGDLDFQNDTMNSVDNGLDFDTINYIQIGYFPHINLPECMPIQDMVELPQVDENEAVDIKTITVVESTDDTAILDLVLNNPGGGEVKSLTVNDIGKTEILSQEQDLRYTNVRIQISEPEKYYSEYDFATVTVKNNYSGGADITRTYAEDDKPFQVEFYRGISNTTEWAEYVVKDGTENYKLREDLDFKNIDDAFIYALKIDGILNGDGHTISNVNLKTNSVIINSLNGTLKDIAFRDISGSNLRSIISQTSSTVSTKIEDVQLENITLTGTSYGSGALIVNAFYDTEIVNISAKNITIHPTSGNIQIGGLVGYLRGTSSLENSFVQDLEMTLYYGEEDNNTAGIHYPYGAGGLVGYTDTGTVINNCYADGYIKSSLPFIGGISGNGTIKNITNCYSNVDITTTNCTQSSGPVGGIVGASFTEQVLKNLLSLGDLDCTTKDVRPRRISTAGSVTQTKWKNSNDWAYSGQMINGKEEETVTDAAGLLTYEDLTKPDTYINTIKMGDAFDYSNVSGGYLPLLYRKGTTELLPGQDNILIDDSRDNVSVLSVTSQNATETSATLVIKLSHPLGYKVDSLVFDNLEISGNINQQEQAGGTVSNIVVDVTPKKYYDNYRLLKINEDAMNVKIDQTFYKQIATYEDWQNIDSNSYENYRLISDITFTEDQSRTMNRNLNVNRFVGPETGMTTLRGITLNLDGNTIPVNTANVFSSVQSEFGNIRVENFTINTVEAGKTSSIYDTSIGFIWRVHGNIHDLELENIQINQANTDVHKGQNVGFICKSMYNNLSEQISNVKMKNVSINGRMYIGGLSGQHVGDKMIANVYAQNISVTGQGSYVGGICGYTSVLMNGITLLESTVNNFNTSTTGTGGIAGSGPVSYSVVEHCNITSTGTMVGGVSGNTAGNHNYVRDSKVEGKEYVGGIGGALGGDAPVRNNYVINCEITGDSGVGGLGGVNSSENYWVHDCGVVDSTVIGTSQVGGIMAKAQANIHSCFVRNTTIHATGGSAGGITGWYYGKNQHTITDNSIQAEVIADEGSAGGVIGYYDVQLNTAGRNDLEVSRNIVNGSGIYGTVSAGGLVGTSSIDNYYREWKGNILLSDVTSGSGGNGSSDYAIGANSDNALIRTMRVHNSVCLDGEPVDSVIQPEVPNPGEEAIDTVQVVDSNYLSQKENYLALGYKDEVNASGLTGKETTHYWCFDGLADGNMPNSSLEYFRTRPSGLSATYGASVLPDGESVEDYQVYGTDLQTWIPIPADANAILLLADHSAELPEAEVFTSGVDTINVEFSGVDDPGESGVFYYLNGDESQAQPVRSVVTLNYDFAEPLTITITNGVDEEEVIVDPEDYTRKVMTWGEDYYYISGDGSLRGSGATQDGDFIHLYDGKALTGDGQILDAATGESAGSVNGASIAEETVALQTFEYGGTVVESYGTFSTVETESSEIIDAATVRPMQLLMNSGKLGALDGSLPIVKDSLILDSYQEEHFQTVLGTDGVVYDLKDPLHLPDGFNNQNVKYMTNNLHSTSHYVLVEYEDGSLAGYNYVTGETLFEEESERSQNNVSFLAFARSFFSFDQPVISTEASEVYRELRDFQKELEEAPVEEVMEELGLLEAGNDGANTVVRDSNDTENKDGIAQTDGSTSGNAGQAEGMAQPEAPGESSQSAFESVDSYIPYYDAEKSEYVLYSTAELLDADVDEVVSENEKIEASPDLKKYYSMPATAMKLEDGNTVGIALFVVLIVMIGSGLGYLFIRKRENS